MWQIPLLHSSVSFGLLFTIEGSAASVFWQPNTAARPPVVCLQQLWMPWNWAFHYVNVDNVQSKMKWQWNTTTMMKQYIQCWVCCLWWCQNTLLGSYVHEFVETSSVELILWWLAVALGTTFGMFVAFHISCITRRRDGACGAPPPPFFLATKHRCAFFHYASM